jgi:hypothetical protein
VSVEKTYVLELVRYRDAGLPTYTWFYVIDSRVVSPYFGSELEAEQWLFKTLKQDNTGS